MSALLSIENIQKGVLKMTEQSDLYGSPVVKAGQKPRAQLRLPQGSYVQADQWMEFLGYEQYCWWIKFHTWVNRKPTREYDNHIPYTLESVFEKLKVSKATFYRKIKILWECGLIDLIEFDKSTRKTTKPRNIIVYEYPFNNAKFEYLELEKKRDWATEYESESKKHGYRGALKTRKDKGLNSETGQNKGVSPVDNETESVDNPVDNAPVDNVDNVDNKGLNSETVEGLNSETVRVSNLRPNNVTNNLITKTNNSINDLNNSLSHTEIDLIQKQLNFFNFKEGETKAIIELINNRQIKGLTIQEITRQAEYMAQRDDIIDRPIYFINGIERRIAEKWGRISGPGRPIRNHTPKNLPFYNWLEE